MAPSFGNNTLTKRKYHVHICVLGRQAILSEVAEGGASFGLWVLENGIGFAWCSSKWIP